MTTDMYLKIANDSWYNLFLNSGIIVSRDIFDIANCKFRSLQKIKCTRGRKRTALMILCISEINTDIPILEMMKKLSVTSDEIAICYYLYPDDTFSIDKCKVQKLM